MSELYAPLENEDLEEEVFAYAPDGLGRQFFRCFHVRFNDPESRLPDGFTRFERFQRYVTDNARLAVAGSEVGERTGRHHRQCYLELPRTQRFNSVVSSLRDVLGMCEREAGFRTSIYIRPANGTRSENFAYCTKSGDFWEFNPKGVDWSKETSRGHRDDLVKARKRIEKAASQPYASWDEIISDSRLDGVRARYPQWVRETFDLSLSRVNRVLRAEKFDYESVVLRPWQQSVVDIIECEPDVRKIYFVVDEVGNSGKTFLIGYLQSIYRGVERFGPVDSRDIAYSLMGPRVAIFDYPRKLHESAYNYTMMEAIKDGCVHSSKYVPRLKEFPPPHVFVFCNHRPLLNVLSGDRYAYIEMDP